ncbi:MAG TPA: hypothetical protein VFH43_11260, partial [Candidatus Kapabacteria bacterium]|nr:hypothetical protein [Candidatus Kapabacteria bacterium]
FDLHMRFNFRALEVALSTNLELPVVREMLREQARRAMLRTEERIKADKYAPLDRSLLNGAVLDWSLSSALLPAFRTVNYSIGAGLEFLGGDLTASTVGTTDDKPTLARTPITWRYSLPDSRIVSQVVAGNNIQFPGTVALPYATGVHITNTPVTFRQGFSSYVVRDYTEPNWMVELYVNNRLVDYARADAAGYFQFSTPLPYGTTNIRLKFYGPFGEERTREKLVQVPYTFVPPGEVEYGITAARLFDTSRTYYGSAGVQAGITSWLTIGGGSYYFRDSAREPFAPVGSMSIRIADQLLINAAYIHGFEAKGHLTYSLPGGMNADLSYVKFAREQRFFSRSILEERRLTLGTPLRFSWLPGALRASATQSITETGDDIFAEAGLTTVVLNTPITYVASSQIQRKPAREMMSMKSNLSMLLQMPLELLLRPEAEFDHKRVAMNSLRATLERHLGHYGWITVGFEHNFQFKTNTARLDLRVELGGAQVFTSASRSNEWNLTQGVRGSIGIDGRTLTPILESRSMLGRGGITLRPFLDKNYNDTLDDGEPLVNNVDLQISTGRMLSNPNDAIIRISDLEPFYPLVLKTTSANFENIAWQPRYPTYMVQVEPNQFKTVDLPIYVAGEAMGRVARAEGDAGLSGAFVFFRNKETGSIDSTITTPSGEFDVLSLVPGKYEAYVDPAHLAKLNLRTDPATREFTIREREEGDVVENLNFKVSAK